VLMVKNGGALPSTSVRFSAFAGSIADVAVF
jgi:hypothetical protein